MVMAAVHIIVPILVTQVGLSLQQNRFPLPPSGCICPGSNLTFECKTEGRGITVWNGTFFTNCLGSLRRKSIPLDHDHFTTDLYYGMCNNGSVVAQPHSHRPVEDGIYTSQLDIDMTMTSLLNGDTLTCAHDHLNGTVTIVGTWTMIDPPTNLRLEQRNETHLKFSWDSVFPNCPPFTYNIYTTNCGLCLNSVNSPAVLCEILDSELTDEQVCSIAVQKKCGGVHVATRFGNISDILQVMQKDDGNSLNTANGHSLGIGPIIGYSVAAIGTLSLLSAIGLLAIVSVIKDFYWTIQHTIDFYVSDEPTSLSKALKVFKEHNVNITFVYTHSKTRLKNQSTICRGFHISYECPKAKVHTLMKKLQQAAGAELVNLENSTDDTSESGPTTHLANSTVLYFSVKEKRGTLADAVIILGSLDVNIICLNGGDHTDDIRNYILECDCPENKKKILFKKLTEQCGINLDDEEIETGIVEFEIPNIPGQTSDIMELPSVQKCKS